MKFYGDVDWFLAGNSNFHEIFWQAGLAGRSGVSREAGGKLACGFHAVPAGTRHVTGSLGRVSGGGYIGGFAADAAPASGAGPMGPASPTVAKGR